MSRDRIITAIDIGSSKIATVIASQQIEGKISVIGVSSVPSRGIKRGVVVDIDEAVDSIASCLEAAERMAGYAVSSALVSVDGNHITSQNSHGVVAVHDHDGEISNEDVARVTDAARAISLPSSREIIHVIPRGFIVDAQDGVKDPVGMSGIRLEVETNIITGATSVIRNLTKCVQQVGLDVDELVFGGLASGQAVLSDTERELGCALVDIGGGTTKIVIFLGGSPAYVSVIPVGGRHITNDLAAGLHTHLETAEQIKLKLSGGNELSYIDQVEEIDEKDSRRSRRRVRDIDISDLNLELQSIPETVLTNYINLRLEEIFKLVGAEIKKSGYSKLIPSGVILTGGAAETIGIEIVGKRSLQMPMRVGYPTGLAGLTDEIHGPAYSTAVGLLLYGENVTSAPKSSALSGANLGGFVDRARGLLKTFMP